MCVRAPRGKHNMPLVVLVFLFGVPLAEQYRQMCHNQIHAVDEHVFFISKTLTNASVPTSVAHLLANCLSFVAQ